ncbi:MAG: ATP-binding protein [Verrucomicrobia bacterium]|nr:ATP-binding protein [Verrucomicrobiota bacterium]
MPEIEITEIAPLSPAQQSVANCHSLLNLYNVLREELGQLGREMTGDPALLAAGLGECARRVERLTEHGAAMHDAVHVHDLEALVRGEIDLHRAAHGPTGAGAAAATCAQLDVIFWILSVRARELVARVADPGHVAPLAIAELELDLQEFFRALEQHSRGRYRFVYNLAVQEAHDYYVDLRIQSTRSSGLVLPTLLRDTLRDLIANARKYTPPGGQLRVALHSSPAGFRCVVEDTGRGIPAGELAEVVKFGRRGSNVSDVRSYGAGCGLTKAVLATRQFGGRFWIGSELGRGTRVRLWLPQLHGAQATMPALQD